MKITMFFLLAFLSFTACVKQHKLVNGSAEIAQLFSIDQQGREFVVTTMDEAGHQLSKLKFDTAFSFKRVVLLNTTYLSYVKALGQEDRIIAGVDLERLVHFLGSSTNFKLENVGGQGVLNLEKIQSLQPDLIICNSFQKKEFLSFKECPVVVVNEFWEHDPLAKAEWVKLFGVLLGQQLHANELFQGIESRYKAVVNREHGGLTPKVYNLSRFNQSYFLPGCNSLITSLLKGAQAKVYCVSETTKAQEISQEQQLNFCNGADFLIYFDWFTENRTYQEVIDDLSLESCFKGKIVYCNTTKSAYFEKAILEPEVVLQGLYEIIHGLKRKTTYFQVLEQ